MTSARYKGLYGGRGSGKSHFFGELLVETCQAERGTLAVCIREAQRTLAQSSKRLIERKIVALGLGHGFKLFSDKIETPGDGLIIFRGMKDYGTIAIRDANGFSHEILHTHARHVAVGDPVAAGQLIGTMGNTGVEKRKIESGASHVHYQLKDPSGNVINPSAFWDQEGPVDPNPAPPGYLDEYQRYLRGLNATLDNAFGNVPNAGPIYGAQPADQLQPLIASRQSTDDPKNVRVLGRLIADQPLPPRIQCKCGHRSAKRACCGRSSRVIQ